MCTPILDSLKSQIDTVFLHTDNTLVLEKIIDSQNVYYTVLITAIVIVFSVLLGINTYVNSRKIKSTLENELKEEINKNKIDATRTIALDIRKEMDEKLAQYKNKTEIDFYHLNGETYRMIGHFLVTNNAHQAAFLWLYVGARAFRKTNNNYACKELINSMIDCKNKMQSTQSKKDIFDSLSESEFWEDMKKNILDFDKVFKDETNQLKKFITDIENDKHNTTVPTVSANIKVN